MRITLNSSLQKELILYCLMESGFKKMRLLIFTLTLSKRLILEKLIYAPDRMN